MNLAELTGSTGLLLVSVLCSSDLGDGLTIRHLRSKKLYIYTEFVDKTPFYDVDMLLTISFKDGLTKLLVVIHNHGRILRGYFLEGIPKLLLVLNHLSLDGALIFGCRENYLVIVDS